MVTQSNLKKDLYCSLAVAILALFITVSTHYPHLSSYAVIGDSAAPLLHSARFFDISPLKWFIDGFRYYSLNYPEASVNFTYFIRPTSNLLIYLISFITDSPNSVIFLIFNYIGHSITCVLVYLFSRTIVRLSRANSILASFLFMTSVSSYSLFRSMAFGVDMIGAIFGMSALMLMYVYVNHCQKPLLLATIILLLFLSVYAKETAIVAPLLVTIYFIAEATKANQKQTLNRFSLVTLLSTIQTNWKIITLILFPSFVYVLHIIIIRLAFATGLASYAEVGTVSTLLKRPFRFLIIFFYPLDIYSKPLVEGFQESLQTNPIRFIRDALAIVLNVISSILILFITTKKAYRQKISYFLVLAIIALAVPIILVPFARFMYLGQMISLPIFVYVVSQFYRKSRNNYQKRLVTIIIIIALLINPVYSVYRWTNNQEQYVPLNHYAKQFQHVLSEEIKNPKIDRIYLINDIVGINGSLSQLKYLTSLANRQDITLRVVNFLEGYHPHDSVAGEGVQVELRNESLFVSIQLGKDERLDFPSVPPENLVNLGVNGLIQYDFEGQLKHDTPDTHKTEPLKKLTVSIPHVSRKDYLLIGFDPSQPGVHILRPNDTKWHLASSSET